MGRSYVFNSIAIYYNYCVLTSSCFYIKYLPYWRDIRQSLGSCATFPEFWPPGLLEHFTRSNVRDLGASSNVNKISSQKGHKKQGILCWLQKNVSVPSVTECPIKKFQFRNISKAKIWQSSFFSVRYFIFSKKVDFFISNTALTRAVFIFFWRHADFLFEKISQNIFQNVSKAIWDISCQSKNTIFQGEKSPLSRAVSKFFWHETDFHHEKKNFLKYIKMSFPKRS
jgi:hypothetical protein